MDYNQATRIKKIKESNDYLISLIESKEIPKKLKEAIK